MAGPHDSEHSDELPDGGPVKSFLEHLEDFRWLLVKVSIALVLAMLVCLFGANYVVGILKWPLTHAKASFPGTNQIVNVRFGTNSVGNFTLTDDQQKSFNLGTNRFVTVTVEPLTVGTNQVLGWRVDDNPQAVAAMQQMKVELVNFSPAGGFFVAIQVAFYGGLDGRQFTQPAIPKWDYRFNLRLLQHDLAYPDRIRIARTPPRQIAGIGCVPLQQERNQPLQV